MKLVVTQPADIAHSLERVPLPRLLGACFAGAENAPRTVGAARIPHDSAYLMRRAEARPIGEQVLLRYVLEGRRD